MWLDLTFGPSFKVKLMVHFSKFLSGGYNLHWFSDALGLVCRL